MSPIGKGASLMLAQIRDVIILQNLAEIVCHFAGTGTVSPSMAISLDRQSSVPCRSIPSPQINGKG